METHLLDGTVVHYEDPCEHHDVVPVESIVDGATVAWLCSSCDLQLPAAFRRDSPTTRPGS